MKNMFSRLRFGNKKEIESVESNNNNNNKKNLLNTFYKNIKIAGFNPTFIVDIGANTGTWTREFISFFANTKVLMIEPQEWLVPHFQDILCGNIFYLPCGVSNKNDILKFTLHERDDSCSFIYSEEEAKKMGLEQKEIPVKTLNSIIAEGNFPVPDIIKIDAEGFDLEVIEGASDFYGKTEIFLVEASVCNNVYRNTVAKIISKMDECGYLMYEITDMNRPFEESPILWLIEIAFVKKDGYIMKAIKNS
jgi:FkbM family methyltransferase